MGIISEVEHEKKPTMLEKDRHPVIVNRIQVIRLFTHGRRALSKAFWIWSVCVVGSVGLCQAGILNQTDFENGTIAPWKMFVTPNGTLGEAGWPEVVSLETTKNGIGAKALRFKVGQVRYEQDTDREQGGGLVFQTTTEAGMLDLAANVAVSYYSPKDKRNLAGGLFEWVVDDDVIASHDMGPIENDGILRHHLKAQHEVIAGLHIIRLRITRPFVSHPGKHAPLQYVDALVIRHSSHP